ncbi:molybdopterin-binding protein [Roseobacter sinensis]|uniref:Molybdopterin molybdenumtransferase n=1 Tax=Roseobacter sinensis TaxID=2931391 RepID=A0ABT3BAP8_9RHOB|nr:gephyrin-like molybdotransferase Glp [Roseobacter sp. WL0113]MCV3270651.1 molybdopterin-binding protein [Roseobacter sp. WL0113]
MRPFDTFVVVDWSAKKEPSPKRPSPDAIWVGVARLGSEDVACDYHRTRHEAMQSLIALVSDERGAGRRVLLGFDFPFGYPRGFARIVTGGDDPLAIWAALAERIKDHPNNANNRFDVAEDLNRLCPGIGPFWGCPPGRATPDLPARGTLRRDHGLPERRGVEQSLPTTQPCWKLFTTGSVGSQALLGLPRLQILRQRFGDEVAVAPFQSHDRPIVLAEVWPSLLRVAIADLRQPHEILDRAQVRVLAGAMSRLPPETLNAMLRAGDKEEGTILGVSDAEALHAAAMGGPARLSPPPLSSDCFALPRGVDWTPVDETLALLRERLSPVTGVTRCAVIEAAGRVLAQDVIALRSNPPLPNTAVDGYGFAGGKGEGVHRMPLTAGRAAAGDRPGAVAPGRAVRILTGAALPEGVDTVVLQEDVTLQGDQIAFRGPIKPGANTRAAGEDVAKGAVALKRGTRVGPAEAALLAAVGVREVALHAALRVAVISTGAELVEAAAAAGPGQIFDANRPMLLEIVRRLGHVPVDMGIVPDDRVVLSARLDRAAVEADLILTSGGASAGDEDHVSALLKQAGAMTLWRIAVKPGRPLALGFWSGVPVFGLPGNPVAAMTCALIFARPAMARLAGEPWPEPQGFDVPAGFTKTKKPGRSEFLRARINAGRVEVFPSEGSGRVSGLSWADGLVELPHGAADISPGTPVRYIPFGSFGL